MHFQLMPTCQQVSTGDGVRDAGTLVLRVHSAHQREGEVEDVAVDEVALATQQHAQDLQN